MTSQTTETVSLRAVYETVHEDIGRSTPPPKWMPKSDDEIKWQSVLPPTTELEMREQMSESFGLPPYQPWWKEVLPPPATWHVPQPVMPRIVAPLVLADRPWYVLDRPTHDMVWKQDIGGPFTLFPSGAAQTLTLRPTEVWRGIKRGGEMVWHGGRWVVKNAYNKVLGPIGAVGTIYDLWQFSDWVNERYKADPGTYVKTKYELGGASGGQLLWHYQGSWHATPPPKSYWG